MPRAPRIDYPGAFHHVMHRGARKAPIFARPDDCVLLLDTVEDAVERFDVEVHAYSLMPNHYHLLVRSLQGDLSRFMQFVDGLYTQRLNSRHRWDGPVFRGRFHSQLVRRPRHLRFLLPYLHLNPVRANLAKRPDEECWTSHRAYLGLERPPDWLTRRYFLRLLGGRDGLKALVTDVHRGRIAWPPDLDLDSGVFTDDDDSPDTDAAPDLKSAAGRAPAPARLTPAEILGRVSAITGATESRLSGTQFGPGANPARRFAVWALARHAGLSHREVGEHLDMTTTAVSKVLSRLRAGEPPEPLRRWMQAWGESARAHEADGASDESSPAPGKVSSGKV